jgi:hypothetical protein
LLSGTIPIGWHNKQSTSDKTNNSPEPLEQQGKIFKLTAAVFKHQNFSLVAPDQRLLRNAYSSFVRECTVAQISASSSKPFIMNSHNPQECY